MVLLLPEHIIKLLLNICETMNKGIEATINTRNIVTKDFEWSSSVAFAYNKEEILKLTSGIANNITNGVYTLNNRRTCKFIPQL